MEPDDTELFDEVFFGRCSRFSAAEDETFEDFGDGPDGEEEEDVRGADGGDWDCRVGDNHGGICMQYIYMIKDVEV